MIQQVITCDVCGVQKRQANHWFVAREEAGEFRISGWNSLQLLTTDTTHLCGETCAHKLLSQYLMKLAEAGTHGTLAAIRAAHTSVGGSECDALSSVQRTASVSIAEHARLDRGHPCTGRRAS